MRILCKILTNRYCSEMDIFYSLVQKITLSPRYVRHVSHRQNVCHSLIEFSIFSFLMCSVLVKFLPLSGDHRAGTGSKGFRVPARRRKFLETAQTAGSNQDCYMSKNTTKYSDINQFSVY